MSLVVNRKELGLRWKHEFGDFMEGESTLIKTSVSLIKKSRLFIPLGSSVISLSIRWASRAFLTESRLLWIRSKGMSRISLMEWPGWIKCVETAVGLSSWWWFRIERRCSPLKALVELAFGFPNVLFFAYFTMNKIN